jgi:hypothetical protein
MRLSDETIAAIVQIIQFGFLSGTDVSDYFRNLELEDVDGFLVPTPRWTENFEREMREANNRVLELNSQG